MSSLLRIMAAWGPDTAHKYNQWTPENPSRGQCLPTALCVQDLRGGFILTVKVGNERHYWNVDGRGETIDLTLAQYPHEKYYRFVEARPFATRVDRHRLLSRNADVRSRYGLLAARAGMIPQGV